MRMEPTAPFRRFNVLAATARRSRSISGWIPTKSCWSYSAPEFEVIAWRVSCKIGSTTLPVAYAGPQLQFVGEDQVNVPLPKSLRGAGTVAVLLTVDGQAANTVTLSFR